MIHKKKIAMALTLTLFGGWALPASVLAQHEWDNFAIGECLILNAGDSIVKFDTSPELIAGWAYTCVTSGGELTLTDPRTGQLQFIDGLNRDYETMAGSGGYGATNGALGCPVPGDDSAWFILGSSNIASVLWKIDMRGDSGLGAVTILNQDFAKNMSYGGSAVVPHSDGFHYWFISPGSFAPNASGGNVITKFYSYLIGPDGPVLSPVVSKVPVDLTTFYYGSPDGSTLVADAQFDSIRGNWGIGVFHIDQSTGKISFDHEIETGNIQIIYEGAHYAFSPNGKVLYYSAFDEGDSMSYLLQYDLTRLEKSDAPYVVAESKDTAQHGFGANMALAGNGRIYGESNYWKYDKRGLPDAYFYSINSPDSIGPACHFVDTAFSVGHTEGLAIWNGVPRVVHSKLAQISAVSLGNCQSSCYGFSRPDSVAGFPHWSFEGGTPATATGPNVPEVCFDSAGPYDVFAVTSAGDTLFDLVTAGTPSGGAIPLLPVSATVKPGGTYTLPVELKLEYANGGPEVTGDTIGHLMQEYVIQFDTSVLSLPSNPALAVSLPERDEIYSARQTGGSLTLVFEDTLGTAWQGSFNGNYWPWRDTMDKISVRFHVTSSNNWHTTRVTLNRFSLDDGYGSRFDFCPGEDNALALITNANAGVAEREPSSGGLRLFPNPATNELQVLGGPAGTARLFDLLGRELMDANDDGSGASLDVSHLEPGTYFLRLGNQSAKVEIAR
jgi:hypothetical protein